MFIAVVILAVWVNTLPKPVHEIIIYSAEVEEKVTVPVGSGYGRASTTMCVFTDLEGKRHTFTDGDYYREQPCLLYIGDKIMVTYDKTWKRVQSVEPVILRR